MPRAQKRIVVPVNLRGVRVRPLPDGWGIHEAALVPKIVEAALETERGKITLKTLAVVAHLFDDLVGPAIIEAEHLSGFSYGAHETLDYRVLALQLTIDVL